jgi:hypothetical protein
MDWSTFWATFSQTHLVTLAGAGFCISFVEPLSICVNEDDAIVNSFASPSSDQFIAKTPMYVKQNRH